MARLSIATVKICATLEQPPSLPGWAPVGGPCALTDQHWGNLGC